MARTLRAGGIAAAITLTLSTLTVLPATAEPATTVSYPAGATTTRLVGKAFDTCTAPKLSTMKAWRSDPDMPYQGVGVYIGGPNRTCAQPELTAAWVAGVSQNRWRIVPIYMGRQAPCTFRGPGSINISSTQAESQGTASATDAVTKAAAIGLRPGTAIYGDMEHYDANNTACRTVVLRYLSAWTKELHRRGYLSGVYAHLYSGAKHLSQYYGSTSYARPDALWIARWDRVESLRDWKDIPNAHWASGQRGKQYWGDHYATYGGVRLNIDSDLFDAPVATVSYPYKVTSPGPLNARSGPSTSYSVVRTYAPGSTLYVRCQLPGSSVGGTKIWNKLADGTYVTDYYVSTPGTTGYSAPLPLCLLPYQVTGDSVNLRTGPGTGYAIAGSLPAGALARVLCQRTGSKYGTTSIWNKLNNGRYVTDYLVATPSNTGYSPPLPRC